MNEQVVAEAQLAIDPVEIIEGLKKPQKTLPSKYLYDRRGSGLFEKICKLEEYYPTVTEVRIMEENINDITDHLGSDFSLIELGSGSSYKTRLLLDHLKSLQGYYPVDISGEFLFESVEDLKTRYPGIQIHPIVADYTQHIPIPTKAADKRVVYFPGSTIGNFTRHGTVSLLKKVHATVAPTGGLLIGVDLKKDRQILEAAYNDSEGVTALFNKNILLRLNRELEADFDVEKFDHQALYNEIEGRIEMHLKSNEPQDVHIGNESFSFSEGETIHTENSYKYTLKEFESLVSGQFRVEKTWTDASDFFSVRYLSPV